jgi:MFS family permease
MRRDERRFARSFDAAPAGLAAVPRAVWAIGFTSLFMDLSSEMVHALLPLFLVGGLGAGVLVVGLIEGASEGAASFTKMFSGWASDRLGRRKGLALFGYTLAAASKPLFPLAAGPGAVLAARLLDRFGKGVRGAPRDALVADLTPAPARGAAYGLRQALDTAGAILGPLAASALMLATAGAVRTVLWAAVAPAFVAAAIMAVFVKEPPRRPPERTAPPLRLAEIAGLGPALATFIGIVFVLNVARLGEAFLLLGGHDVGLDAALVPLVLAAMNVVYMAVVYPAGRLSDRLGRSGPLAAGLLALALADAALAAAAGPALLFAGAMLWGAHMGLTQGVLSAIVADLAPARLRGTAFGVFHMASGLAFLAGGALAGFVWQEWGRGPAFSAGAGIALAGAAAALAWAGRYGAYLRKTTRAAP